MKKMVVLLLFFACFFTGLAEVHLPAIIGDHMILQQNSIVKIWGWADVSEKIVLKTDWDTATYTTTGDLYAKWSLQIKTPGAGGPHTITITGRNTIVIEDVLVGEVWLCSGQSNMEMTAGCCLQRFEPDAAAAINKDIHFFSVPRITSPYPQEELRARWVVCSPEEMRRFSLAGYFFGQKINRELGVPVGLINCSWGGLPAEVFTPIDTIETDQILKVAAAKLKPVRWGPILPGYVYNAMIYPFVNYLIAGTIWYQGESNVDGYSTYNRLFSALIVSWRKAWGREFPFYFVQIAPYAGYGKNDVSAFLREQQTKTLSIPNTGMVITSDLVDNINDIHPQLKKEVGLRLANYALADLYKKNIPSYKSPAYDKMEIEKDKIRISFSNAEKGLTTKGDKDPTEFYIAGDDAHFVPASTKIEGNTVVVWNKIIKNPVAVRFGFTNTAMPNLFSKEGLPVNLFRTDDWDVHITVLK